MIESVVVCFVIFLDFGSFVVFEEVSFFELWSCEILLSCFGVFYLLVCVVFDVLLMFFVVVIVQCVGFDDVEFLCICCYFD